jgi:hypothetical protein
MYKDEWNKEEVNSMRKKKKQREFRMLSAQNEVMGNLI